MPTARESKFHAPKPRRAGTTSRWASRIHSRRLMWTRPGACGRAGARTAASPSAARTASQRPREPCRHPLAQGRLRVYCCKVKPEGLSRTFGVLLIAGLLFLLFGAAGQAKQIRLRNETITTTPAAKQALAAQFQRQGLSLQAPASGLFLVQFEKPLPPAQRAGVAIVGRRTPQVCARRCLRRQIQQRVAGQGRSAGLRPLGGALSRRLQDSSAPVRRQRAAGC